MALPVTDTFSGTNGDALPTYDSDWVENSGGFQILTGGLVHPDTGVECGAHHSADTYDDDQYIIGEVGSVSVDTTVTGIAGRVHASAETYYGAYFDTANIYVFKNVAGSWTQLGAAFSISVNAGDFIKLEIIGTDLELFLDTGGGYSSQGTRSDPAISSGSAGLSGWGTDTDNTLTSWEGGNTSPGGATRPPSLTLLGVG